LHHTLERFDVDLGNALITKPMPLSRLYEVLAAYFNAQRTQ
jgi:hypothetical protein